MLPLDELLGLLDGQPADRPGHRGHADADGRRLLGDRQRRRSCARRTSSSRSAAGRRASRAGQRVISEATAASLRKMLEGVLGPGGTASGAAIPGYELAGKTGTAREGRPERRLLRRTSTSPRSSASRPPSDPKLLVAVMVDEPQGEIYGGQVAAPAWQRDRQLRAQLPEDPARVRLQSVDTLRTSRDPRGLNQSVPFEDVDLLRGRPRAARGARARGRRLGASTACATPARVAGSAEAQEHGRRAERNEPRLLTHDRYGHRDRPGRARPVAGTGCCAARSSARSTRCRGATRSRARTWRAPRSSLPVDAGQRRRDVPGLDDLLGGPGAARATRARRRVGAAADAARLRARRAVRAWR